MTAPELENRARLEQLAAEIHAGGRTWLFLDYDGTLAAFAPTPDTILPDEALIALVGRLARQPDRLRVVVLSGRRLDHIRALLPVDGVVLAGTYGIEMQTRDGEQVHLIDLEPIRPVLEAIKAGWTNLVEGREGFYVEDKGFAVALHARRAPDADADEALREAERAARAAAGAERLTLEGGYKFLEAAPAAAKKGQSIRALLERYPWEGARLVYLGDDDKDEDAFETVRALGGTGILVAQAPRPTAAVLRLESPQAVRAWLARLVGT
jgi:trehalose 6-phosphate phosphatase